MPSVQAWTLPHKGTCTSVMWSEVKNYRKKKETWFVKSWLVKTNKQRLLLSVKQSIWRFILHFNALCDNFSTDLLLFSCNSKAAGCQTAIKSPIRNILLYHLPSDLVILFVFYPRKFAPNYHSRDTIKISHIARGRGRSGLDAFKWTSPSSAKLTRAARGRRNWSNLSTYQSVSDWTSLNNICLYFLCFFRKNTCQFLIV